MSTAEQDCNLNGSGLLKFSGDVGVSDDSEPAVLDLRAAIADVPAPVANFPPTLFDNAPSAATAVRSGSAEPANSFPTALGNLFPMLPGLVPPLDYDAFTRADESFERSVSSTSTASLILPPPPKLVSVSLSSPPSSSSPVPSSALAGENLSISVTRNGTALVKTCKLCGVEVTRGADNRNAEHLRTATHTARAEHLYCGLACKNKLVASRRGTCVLAATGLSLAEHTARARDMRAVPRGDAPPERRVAAIGARLYCRTCLLRVDADVLTHIARLSSARRRPPRAPRVTVKRRRSGAAKRASGDTDDSESPSDGDDDFVVDGVGDESGSAGSGAAASVDAAEAPVTRARAATLKNRQFEHEELTSPQLAT